MNGRPEAKRSPLDPWLLLAGLSGLAWLFSSYGVEMFFGRLAHVLESRFGI